MLEPSALLALAEPIAGLPEVWEQLLGRLHPSLVHVPIGLLMFALLFEVWGVRKRGPVPSAAGLPCLLFGALGALAAAGSGWLLAGHDDPGRSAAELLFWHRWLGVALAVLASVAAALALRGRKGDRPGAVEASRFLLCFVAPLVAVVGHLGGSMVHGELYVTGPLRAALQSLHGDSATEPGKAPAKIPAKEPTAAAPTSAATGSATSALALPGTDVAGAAPAGKPAQAASDVKVSVSTAIDFARDVVPIFEARCLECHGPEKVKGDLRLDQPLDEGPEPHILVPGDPAASELFQRVTLPAADLDIMPAKGDPLSAAQIAVLRRWIEQGASWGAAGP